MSEVLPIRCRPKMAVCVLLDRIEELVDQAGAAFESHAGRDCVEVVWIDEVGV